MPSYPHVKKGFTLIEVVISIALLVLLSGALFSLVSSVLESKSLMSQRLVKQNRLIAWDFFLRSTLQKLETDSIIITEEVENLGIGNSGYRIRFINATIKVGPFAEYDSNSSFIIETVAGVPKGSLTLQLIPYSALNESGNLAATFPPFALVENISDIRFEFYNAQSNEWSTEWLQNNQKPSAIKNRITLRSGETHEMIVWIPHA